MSKKLTKEKIEKALLQDQPDTMEVKYAPGVERDMAKLGFNPGYKRTWTDVLLWNLEKVRDFPVEAWDNVKAFYQRGARGYADRDCWGIDWYICEIMPGMLRTMTDPTKGGGNSYPGFIHGTEANTSKRWKGTIEKMAKGFEAHRRLAEFDYRNDAQRESLKKQRDEGIALWVKYFDHLWD